MKARRDIKGKRAKKLERYQAKRNGSIEFNSLLSESKFTLTYRQSYIAFHEQLLSRQVESLPFSKGGGKDPTKRVHEYSLVLTQIYLHRAYNLYIGSFQALASNNVHLMALSIRGYLETVAAVGYLLKRLKSFQQGSISEDSLSDNLFKLLLGNKDKQLQEEIDDNFSAINVMSMLDEADKAFNSQIMEGNVPDKKMLRKIYESLCEFCHPNYDSASLSFQLDTDKGHLRFNHDFSEVLEHEGKIIEDLLIASFAFIKMFDKVVEIASSLKKVASEENA
ncbi:hypothetical protein [Vibrio diabolicus]|uniref:hypothetical protein n=1 Tax=Vibrio diabolicus TaxID=50719 RepID=UPI00215FAA27|nr:hypothetical protein [Vibrio diabolicus]MCS0449271.1 hypothetical protein [Vibrio diabolicus]